MYYSFQYSLIKLKLAVVDSKYDATKNYDCLRAHGSVYIINYKTQTGGPK